MSTAAKVSVVSLPISVNFVGEPILFCHDFTKLQRSYRKGMGSSGAPVYGAAYRTMHDAGMFRARVLLDTLRHTPEPCLNPDKKFTNPASSTFLTFDK